MSHDEDEKNERLQHDYAHDIAGQLQEVFEEFLDEHPDVEPHAFLASLSITDHAWQGFLRSHGASEAGLLSVKLSTMGCAAKLAEYLQKNGAPFFAFLQHRHEGDEQDTDTSSDFTMTDMPKCNVPGGDA